jgi:hypothetical protein
VAAQRQLRTCSRRRTGFLLGDVAAAEEIRTQARDAFGSTSVVTYIPGLVERTVRRRLRAAHHGAAALDVNAVAVRRMV